MSETFSARTTAAHRAGGHGRTALHSKRRSMCIGIAADEKAATALIGPRRCNAHEYKTLQKLADYIIPADERVGPEHGGRRARVDRSAGQQNPQLLRDLHRRHRVAGSCDASAGTPRNFVDARPEQQIALLDLIAYRKNESPGARARHPVLRLGAAHGSGRVFTPAPSGSKISATWETPPWRNSKFRKMPSITRLKRSPV